MKATTAKTCANPKCGVKFRSSRSWQTKCISCWKAEAHREMAEREAEEGEAQRRREEMQRAVAHADVQRMLTEAPTMADRQARMERDFERADIAAGRIQFVRNPRWY